VFVYETPRFYLFRGRWEDAFYVFNRMGLDNKGSAYVPLSHTEVVIICNILESRIRKVDEGYDIIEETQFCSAIQGG
jgi:hypothetical protein